MDRDKLAIEVSKILYKLYASLNEAGEYRVYFTPSIKDKEIAKNCTPKTVELFEEIINERDSINKFVISTTWINGISEEYDKNKITVIISDKDTITLKYRYKNKAPNKQFNNTYIEIKEFLKANTDKKIIEKILTRVKRVILHKLYKANITLDIDYTPTPEETLKLEALCELINKFCEKAYSDEKEYPERLEKKYLKYKENQGYYVLCFEERDGWLKGLYGKDLNEAFKYILITSLATDGQVYEFHNRRTLMEDYANRFGNEKYFLLLYFAEFALGKWNKYYDGNVPADIVSYYENYLNDIWWRDEHNSIWKYNYDKKLFDNKGTISIEELMTNSDNDD